MNEVVKKLTEVLNQYTISKKALENTTDKIIESIKKSNRESWKKFYNRETK